MDTCRSSPWTKGYQTQADLQGQVRRHSNIDSKPTCGRDRRTILKDTPTLCQPIGESRGRRATAYLLYVSLYGESRRRRVSHHLYVSCIRREQRTTVNGVPTLCQPIGESRGQRAITRLLYVSLYGESRRWRMPRQLSL
jgi:hypothetical protein